MYELHNTLKITAEVSVNCVFLTEKSTFVFIHPQQKSLLQYQISKVSFLFKTIVFCCHCQVLWWFHAFDFMPSQSRRHTKQREGVSLIFSECGSSGQASAVYSGQSTLLFIVKPNAVSQHGDSAGVMYTNMSRQTHTCLSGLIHTI